MGLYGWQARWHAHRRGIGITLERSADAEASNSNSSSSSATPTHHGAGWFTSTWDLLTGLDVREGLPDDARPEEALMAYLLGHEHEHGHGHGQTRG